MKRRQVLKYTALITGVAVGMPIVCSLNSCSPEHLQSKSDFSPSFFSNEEFRFISELSDIILPYSNSPSASEVGVPQIIDSMVGKVYTSQQQKNYRKGFDKLFSYLNDLSTNQEKIQNLLGAQNEDIKTEKESFQNFKQQTIAYYLSTEKIGKEFLNYLPVPGEYQECISVEEAGNKAWAI